MRRSSRGLRAAAAWLVSICLALSSGAVAASGTAAVAVSVPVVPMTRAAIDAGDALFHVRVLSSPEMEGRGVLTAGLGRAADYVAKRFQSMGLAGAGDGGGFFQAVDIPLPRKSGPATAFTLAGRALRLGRDFAPGRGSPAARAVGGVVFAGYGIAIPGGYDDYAGVDPRGKLVVCFRYAPHYDVETGKAADSSFTEGATLQAKAAAAINRGAVGLAIVDPPAAAAAAAAADDPLAPLPTGAHGAAGIATFHLGRAATEGLLSVSGQTLSVLRRRIDDTVRPASFELPAFADFTVDWAVPSVPSRNVLAVLPGSDPALRDEAIVIGAHYDHLGRGDEGSALGRSGQVHPGADDNASGTAAVLEIAEAFAAERMRPRRSIIFAAFTGEEKGLIGSAAMAARAGGKRVVGMINLDMVGRMTGNAVEIGGGPTALDWEAIVNAANDEKLVLTFPRRVVPNSDHASFLGKQIPALFLFTGLHADYHRASDTWDKINADGLAKTARLAFRIVKAVANRDQRLAFVAPQWTRMGAAGGAHGTSVRLGVMPDYQSDDRMRVSAVIAGGAGAAGGVMAGDVIEAIGGKPVASIESYMEAMAAFKPGDATVVTIRRDGTVHELNVKFGASGGEAAQP
jgi:aminopeptidase YwaD